MASCGVVDHEGLGAEFLKGLGFSDKIASLVRNHVQAKRYLTFDNPNYYGNLSAASKETLNFQGGITTEQEAKSFEEDPLFESHIMLRHWDERAKRTDVQLPSFAKFRSMILAHLNK